MMDVFPEWFLKGIGKISRDDILSLDRFGLERCRLTGSRYICPAVADHDSDFDVLALATNISISEMKDDGWLVGGSAVEAEMGQHFVSLRQDKINVLACMSEDFYDKFELATELCLSIAGPRHKPDRIKVFRAVLYGETPRGAFIPHKAGRKLRKAFA